MENPIYQNSRLREVFNATRVVKKPVVGIVSDYHELPYILITPSEKDVTASIEISGRIKVSPKLIISASAFNETFGEIFDPATFNSDIVGRVFSFVQARKNLKIQSDEFAIKESTDSAESLVERVHDRLLQQEDIKTALIVGPAFEFYPVSLDRFINEILHKEFRV